MSVVRFHSEGEDLTLITHLEVNDQYVPHNININDVTINLADQRETRDSESRAENENNGDPEPAHCGVTFQSNDVSRESASGGTSNIHITDTENGNDARDTRVVVSASQDEASSIHGRAGETYYPHSDLDDVENPSVNYEGSYYPPVNSRAALGYFDLNTLSTRNPAWLYEIRVDRKLIYIDEELAGLSGQTLSSRLDRVGKGQVRVAICQTFISRTLPRLQREMKLRDIAQCLMVPDPKVQITAVSTLERLLLDLNCTQDTAITEELLDVAKTTQTTFLRLHENETQVFVYFNLHLLALSALLCRCLPPDSKQCLPLLQAARKHKSQSKSGLKYSLLRAMQVFYEDFNDHLDKPSLFRVWSKVESSQKEHFARADFCEQIAYVISIFTEISSEGWSAAGLELIKILRELFEAEPRNAKHKKSSETKAALDFLFIRGLTLLLNSTYVEGVCKVGNQNYKHPQKIADLMVDVIMKADDSYKNTLFREVGGLPFHRNKYVQSAFSDILRNVMSQRDVALTHIENKLQRIGFESCPLQTLAKTSPPDTTTSCAWEEFTCSLSGKRARVAMYVPKPSCLVEGRLRKCMAEHPGCSLQDPRQRAKALERVVQHKQNMEFLINLSPKCKHIVKFFAYQKLPFPFYITEPIEEHRLLRYLLDHREMRCWLSTEKLALAALQIVEALLFLLDENIVLRDVTTYNMIVEAGPENCSGPRCGVLSSDHFVIKLADLGLAHEFRCSRADRSIRPVRDQGPIPLRWTAPEAMFHGTYSHKSASYSLGAVMYELWTHGCQPFTEYDQRVSTEELVMKMFFDPVKPQLGPRHCIPDRVFSLIKRCTDFTPDSRPCLSEIKEELTDVRQSEYEYAQEQDLDTALAWEEYYPSPSPRQEGQNHIPETGIPETLRQILHAKKESKVYKMYEASISRTISRKDNHVSDEELNTHDKVQVQYQTDRTLVEELVTDGFVRKDLPMLEAKELPGINCWLTDEHGIVRVTHQDRYCVHEREYKPCRNLLKVACSGELWNSGESEGGYDRLDSPERWVAVLTSLAKVISTLHENGWIHRDLRAEYVLVDCKNGQAILSRIGRMQHIPSSTNFVVDRTFEDSFRRLAPEVLIGGKYSYANDIFMFGTLIWEIFRSREITLRNPNANKGAFTPIADIPKEMVIEYVNSDTPLPSPLDCPGWVFELILQCRRADPAQRPSALEVLNTFQRHMNDIVISDPFFPNTIHAEIDQHTQDMEPNPAELVKRKLTKADESCRQLTRKTKGSIWTSKFRKTASRAIPHWSTHKWKQISKRSKPETPDSSDEETTPKLMEYSPTSDDETTPKAIVPAVYHSYSARKNPYVRNITSTSTHQATFPQPSVAWQPDFRDDHRAQNIGNRAGEVTTNPQNRDSELSPSSLRPVEGNVEGRASNGFTAEYDPVFFRNGTLRQSRRYYDRLWRRNFFGLEKKEYQDEGNDEYQDEGNDDYQDEGNDEYQDEGNDEYQDAASKNEQEVKDEEEENYDTISNVSSDTASEHRAATVCRPNVATVCGPNVGTVCGPNVGTVCRPNVGTVCGPNVATVCRPNVGTVCGPNVATVCGPNVATVCGPNVATVCGPNVETVCGPTVCTPIAPTVWKRVQRAVTLAQSPRGHSANNSKLKRLKTVRSSAPEHCEHKVTTLNTVSKLQRQPTNCSNEKKLPFSGGISLDTNPTLTKEKSDGMCFTNHGFQHDRETERRRPRKGSRKKMYSKRRSKSMRDSKTGMGGERDTVSINRTQSGPMKPTRALPMTSQDAHPLKLGVQSNEQWTVWKFPSELNWGDPGGDDQCVPTSEAPDLDMSSLFGNSEHFNAAYESDSYDYPK